MNLAALSSMSSAISLRSLFDSVHTNSPRTSVFSIELVVQIADARAALNNVGQIILEDHLRSCMVKAVEDCEFDEAMRDLKTSFDRFIG